MSAATEAVFEAQVRRVAGEIVFDNRFGWIGDAASGSLICQACQDVLHCAAGDGDAVADAHWDEKHTPPGSPARLNRLTAAARLGVRR